MVDFDLLAQQSGPRLREQVESYTEKVSKNMAQTRKGQKGRFAELRAK